MGRKQAREAAMQCLYQMDMLSEYSEARLVSYINGSEERNLDKAFVKDLINKFLQNKDQIDDEISSHLKKDWKLDRIAKIDLAILRTAMTEILCIEDIPESVSINEAVNLSKKFSDESSSSFINGLLGASVGNKKD